MSSKGTALLRFLKDAATLRRQRIPVMTFRFREEFRPNTSLFDHAERAFGNLISLREHFRCVQEDELGDGSPEGQVLRVAESPRVRERPAGRRDLQEIPPSELFVVLERLDSGSLGTELDDEALLRGLLEHYGYNRLTAIRRRYLSRVFELYRANRGGSDSDDVAIECRT
jgi:hypothetical protein